METLKEFLKYVGIILFAAVLLILGVMLFQSPWYIFCSVVGLILIVGLYLFAAAAVKSRNTK